MKVDSKWIFLLLVVALVIVAIVCSMRKRESYGDKVQSYPETSEDQVHLVENEPDEPIYEYPGDEDDLLGFGMGDNVIGHTRPVQYY